MSALATLFQNGASYLISRANYARYIYGHDQLGRWNEALNRGELFVIPREEMDNLLAHYPDQPRVWEEALGLKPGSLGDNPLRVDIEHPYEYNLRLPDGNEIGYTGAGTPGIPGEIPELNEAVTELVPNPEVYPEEGKITEAMTVTVEETTEVEKETTERESMGPDGTVELETETTTTVSRETTVTIEEEKNSNENHLDDGMEI